MSKQRLMSEEQLSDWLALTADDIEFLAKARQDVPALVAEVRRLREALDFYASSDSYIMQDFVIEFTSEIMMDQGKHARNALKGGAQ